MGSREYPGFRAQYLSAPTQLQDHFKNSHNPDLDNHKTRNNHTSNPSDIEATSSATIV
jgi:hypothetical protein